jgi:hypothetical protein
MKMKSTIVTMLALFCFCSNKGFAQSGSITGPDVIEVGKKYQYQGTFNNQQSGNFKWVYKSHTWSAFEGFSTIESLNEKKCSLLVDINYNQSTIELQVNVTFRLYHFRNDQWVYDSDVVKPFSKTIKVRTIKNPMIEGISTVQKCDTRPLIYHVIIYQDSHGFDGYSFNWTIPAGWSINGTANGSQISVTPNISGGGTIKCVVKRSNGVAEYYREAVLNVQRSDPRFNIVSAVQNCWCPNQEQTISATAPYNYSSVSWTVPSGWVIISGQGTLSVRIKATWNSQPGNVTVTGTVAGGCNVISSSKPIRAILEVPQPQEFVVLPNNISDLPHIMWINGKWNVCPGGDATVIETYGYLGEDCNTSYTFSVTAPWRINGQTGTITTTNDYVSVSGPSDAPGSGILTVRATNCIGTGQPSSYTFRRAPAGTPYCRGERWSEDLHKSETTQDALESNPDVIYPNPFTNSLEIKLKSKELGLVEVYSLDGKKVLGEKINNGSLSINTVDWKSGIYTIKINIDNDIRVYKVVK